MFRLYRSPDLATHWVAYSETLGWLLFPAKINGWGERRRYTGDISRLAAVPARLGFNTGFPHPDATPKLRQTHAHVFAEVEARVRRVA